MTDHTRVNIKASCAVFRYGPLRSRRGPFLRSATSRRGVNSAQHQTDQSCWLVRIRSGAHNSRIPYNATPAQMDIYVALLLFFLFTKPGEHTPMFDRMEGFCLNLSFFLILHPLSTAHKQVKISHVVFLFSDHRVLHKLITENSNRTDWIIDKTFYLHLLTCSAPTARGEHRWWLQAGDAAFVIGLWDVNKAYLHNNWTSCSKGSF